tara:strand:- start:90 stop:266 length:177 start_codon:yes stop_codon:yes gene_type:complete
LSKLTAIRNKYDVYDSLTPDELETVTNIFLDALYRENNIKPEIFGIETNIVVDTILED